MGGVGHLILSTSMKSSMMRCEGWGVGGVGHLILSTSMKSSMMRCVGWVVGGVGHPHIVHLHEVLHDEVWGM